MGPSLSEQLSPNSLETNPTTLHNPFTKESEYTIAKKPAFTLTPEEIANPDKVEHSQIPDSILQKIIHDSSVDSQGKVVETGLYIDLVKTFTNWPEYKLELSRVNMRDITSVDKIPAFYKEVDGEKSLWKIQWTGGNAKVFTLYREDAAEDANGKKTWEEIKVQKGDKNSPYKYPVLTFQSDEVKWKNPNANQPLKNSTDALAYTMNFIQKYQSKDQNLGDNPQITNSG